MPNWIEIIKAAWPIFAAFATWLAVVSIWAGRMQSDARHRDIKINELQESHKNEIECLKKQNRDDRDELKKQIMEQRIDIKDIDAAFKRALYDGNGQSIYMPRAGCSEKSEKMFENLRLLHTTELDSIKKDIYTLCGKFEKWQSKVESSLESVDKFIGRMDGNIPLLLSKNTGGIVNQSGGISREELKSIMSEILKETSK